MLDEKDLQAIGALIDAKLAPIQNDTTILKDKVTGIETRLTGVETRLTGVETRLSDMDTRLTGVETRLEKVENEVVRTNLKIEHEIQPQIDALGETQQLILEQLVPRSRVDDLEEEVKFLKVVVRQMNEDLQKLKAAN